MVASKWISAPPRRHFQNGYRDQVSEPCSDSTDHAERRYHYQSWPFARLSSQRPKEASYLRCGCGGALTKTSAFRPTVFPGRLISSFATHPRSYHSRATISSVGAFILYLGALHSALYLTPPSIVVSGNLSLDSLQHSRNDG